MFRMSVDKINSWVFTRLHETGLVYWVFVFEAVRVVKVPSPCRSRNKAKRDVNILFLQNAGFNFGQTIRIAIKRGYS